MAELFYFINMQMPCIYSFFFFNRKRKSELLFFLIFYTPFTHPYCGITNQKLFLAANLVYNKNMENQTINQAIKLTGCCEPFNPEPWQDKEIIWNNKLFARDHIRSFFTCFS